MKKILAFLKDTGEKIQNTHPFMQISSFLACVFLFALMGIGFLFIPDTTRAVFFFPDTRTGRIHTEIRYLPEAKGRDARLTRYVEDLVLGTGLENCIPLFNRGTRLLGCFVRGADAYVNLSADALMPVPGTAPSDQACAIFKKNVFTNFRNIDKIYLYIDGIEVFGGNTHADAVAKNKKTR